MMKSTAVPGTTFSQAAQEMTNFRRFWQRRALRRGGDDDLEAALATIS